MIRIASSFAQTVHAAGSLAAEVLVHLNLAIQELAGLLVVVAVAVVQDGSLSDGHADDRAVLVSAGCPEPVPGLGWSEQDRRDVVDLVRGLSAGALLGSSAATAPTLASVKDQGEEEDEEQKSDQATLRKGKE